MLRAIHILRCGGIACPLRGSPPDLQAGALYNFPDTFLLSPVSPRDDYSTAVVIWYLPKRTNTKEHRPYASLYRFKGVVADSSLLLAFHFGASVAAMT